MRLVWIDAREVSILHDRLPALHGGRPGVRDAGLLESELARPRQHAAYSEAPDIVELASLYTAAIVRNRPFVDGNKRTGFVLGVLFLEMNGHRFDARQEDAANAVLALAEGRLDGRGYHAFMKANSARPRQPRP
ncbi:MAG TPA: type II toxin-antitoxin system death-on-curing family toxin [Zeimonas sp.]